MARRRRRRLWPRGAPAPARKVPCVMGLTATFFHLGPPVGIYTHSRPLLSLSRLEIRFWDAYTSEVYILKNHTRAIKFFFAKFISIIILSKDSTALFPSLSRVHPTVHRRKFSCASSGFCFKRHSEDLPSMINGFLSPYSRVFFWRREVYNVVMRDGSALCIERQDSDGMATICIYR